MSAYLPLQASGKGTYHTFISYMQGEAVLPPGPHLGLATAIVSFSSALLEFFPLI